MTRLQFMTLAFYAVSIQHSLSLHVEATGKSSNAAALRQPAVAQKALEEAEGKVEEANKAAKEADMVATKKADMANKAKQTADKMQEIATKMKAELDALQKAWSAQLLEVEAAQKKAKDALEAANKASKEAEDAKTAKQTADKAVEKAIQVAAEAAAAKKAADKKEAAKKAAAAAKKEAAKKAAAKKVADDAAAKKEADKKAADKKAADDAVAKKAADEAAKKASAKGDPHLYNMQGEFFDINRAGVSTFLQLATEGNQSSIRVEASIEHPGEDGACFGFYIRKLWFKGSLVGEDIVVSVEGTDLRGDDNLVVQIGDQSMRNSVELSRFLDNHAGKYNITLDDKRSDMRDLYKQNRVKFATLKLNIKGAEFVVEWTTGQNKPNILGFSAGNLKQLGKNNWRGLLASDDHTWASSFDPACRKAHDYDNTAQLIGHNDMAGAWSASAHLD